MRESPIIMGFILVFILFLFLWGFIIVRRGYDIDESAEERTPGGFMIRFLGYLLGLSSISILLFIISEGWLISGV